MFGIPSFVMIGRSVRELFSEHPKSPKTRKSVDIRETVSDHSAVGRLPRTTVAVRGLARLDDDDGRAAARRAVHTAQVELGPLPRRFPAHS